jgi:2-oxoglutarate ferredoxin oxidoreductase subunit beta
MVTKEDFETGVKPYWCPGCGDFGILQALKRALPELGVEPHNVVMVSGIGNGSHFPHWLRLYGAHTIHGRLLPFAQGVKLVNHELTVIGIGGDGDGYGIGMGHLVHAMRRNMDINYIVANNAIYGLTTGQASPTSEKGMKTKSTPSGTIEEPVNPITLALTGGATYIARGFAGDAGHLAKLIVEGVRHRGFALIDVLQPCPIWNSVNTHQWYRERVYRLEEEGHDPADFDLAYKRALEWGDRIPIGLFYRADRPTYEDLVPQLKKGPIVKQDIKRDISGLMEEFI